MKSRILFIFLFSLAYGERDAIDQGLHPLSEAMIQRINSLDTTWKAGKNFELHSLPHVKRLLGSQISMDFSSVPKRVDHNDTDNLPESFDSREAWPNCTSIGTIYDQGSCGSDWAIAATSAISDRICIHNSVRVELSAQQVVTCCYFCGLGCTSGDPTNVYQYYWTDGIVSGGSYQGGGCLPYTIEPCEHHVSGPRGSCSQKAVQTPSCVEKCEAGYKNSYNDDKHYGQEPYFFSSEPKQIMKEIMINGPVTANLIVFADFPNYRSGVYRNTTTELLGNHAVKLIGWGTENDTDFWLAANSWNEDWGDEGYFKIKRGTDESFVESSVVAALPILKAGEL